MKLSRKYEYFAANPRGSDQSCLGVDSDSTVPSDQHLVIAARSGCRASFNALWDLYSRRVYRTTLSITKNAQDAEDAMQEAFLRAFLALESFEGRANFYTWLTRIAINSALGMLRQRHRHLEISLDSTFREVAQNTPQELRDLSPNPEQIFEQEQRRAKLMKAIHKLPARLRGTVQSRITGDCSVKEIAYQFNISQAAAKSRLYRARTRLGVPIAARDGSRAIRT
jgi:RNA polymerase sigma-70 factor (ECF subfamily)